MKLDKVDKVNVNLTNFQNLLKRGAANISKLLLARFTRSAKDGPQFISPAYEG